MSAAPQSDVVTISGTLISAHDLETRLRTTRAELEVHQWPEPRAAGLTVADRARRLHALWATVIPPMITKRGGAAGWLAFNVKRTVRKLGAWYIEPRWHAQREIDAEIARFASDSSAAIERLELECAHLSESNTRLQRELRNVKNAGSEGAHRCH